LKNGEFEFEIGVQLKNELWAQLKHPWEIIHLSPSLVIVRFESGIAAACHFERPTFTFQQVRASALAVIGAQDAPTVLKSGKRQKQIRVLIRSWVMLIMNVP
jgi:hypothetical protein